jgi:diguanylate cyclase (GGDEF)-like protein/PAS domain S-box-containing protein/putative nucleotidyltransferase with HDIG domain
MHMTRRRAAVNRGPEAAAVSHDAAEPVRAGEAVSEPIHESSDRAEAIVAAIAEAYGLTVDGRLVSVNQALCDLTGFSRDALIGASDPLPFWPPETSGATAELRDRCLASGGGSFELMLLRRNGDRFEAEMTVRPARNPDGRAFGYVTTARDVSERTHHAAELERDRRALEAAQILARVGSWDQALTGDSPGRWSLELWRMLGLDPRPAAPRLTEFLAMVNPEDRERVAGALERSRLSGEPWVGEFRLRRADAGELHVAFRNEFTHGGPGRATRVLRTIQDITERAEREAEHVALARTAELVADNAPSATVFAAVAGEVRRLFSAHSGMVSRFDELSGVGVVISADTAVGQTLAGATYSLDGISASAQVFRTGAPARFDQPRGSVSDPAAATMVIDGITAGIAAPILVGGHLWGTLGAAFAGVAIPPRAEERLGRLTDLMAMAIANAEAWETLSRQASSDPITGIANHRSFYDRLHSEVERARRHHRELSVVLLDLDHFKRVNDSFGHQAGDRTLAEFARRLEARARDGDLVARIGGEEFAWLMPETDGHSALQAAESLRRAVESTPFETVGQITVSAGVCAGARARRGEDMVGFADRALYRAKDEGRNLTFLYTPEADALLPHLDRRTEGFQTMSSVRALARAVDSKDSSTAKHSDRVAALAEQLARQLGWTEKRARLLHTCGLLHDVGKIGIPDEILLRPGPLSAAEYAQIKRHAAMSAQIAAEVLEHEQVTWIRGHHERWDGAGYPDRLAGDEIPDGAQLLSVADAWDVMTQSRTYKLPQSEEDALADITAESGRQFSPMVVTALRRLRAGARTG